MRLPRPGPRIGVLAWGLFCAACQLGTSLDGYTTSQDASPEIAVEADADVLSDTGAGGGSAEGGSAGVGGGGGLAEGGSAGAGAGGGSAEGGSAGAGAGGGGEDCTPTGSVADLRAKIGRLRLGASREEEFQLCGVVVTYVNDTTGFYLQDPSDKTGIYAHIKVADVPDAKVGNKLHVKVTEYKRHKAGSSDTDGLLQIAEASLTKLDETVDVSTLVQELNVAPTKEFAAELVKVENLEITGSIQVRSGWESLKVKYGSVADVVLSFPSRSDIPATAYCTGKKIGIYQGPVGYYNNGYQLVSDAPGIDLKDVTGTCK